MAKNAVLWAHLVSKHAGIFNPETDLKKMHEHEHDGPGTIRNHPREDRSYDLNKMARILLEGDEEAFIRADEIAKAALPLTNTLRNIAKQVEEAGGTGTSAILAMVEEFDRSVSTGVTDAQSLALEEMLNHIQTLIVRGAKDGVTYPHIERAFWKYRGTLDLCPPACSRQA